MANKKESPKAKIRKSFLSSYRNRGRSNNNLWRVYSPKTDSDWTLPSDRQLIHWLSILESNPRVKTFDLDPDPILSHDSHEDKATIFDAIVTLHSGAIEWHEVKAGKSEYVEDEHRSQFVAQINQANMQGVSYKRFNDNELAPHIPYAMRWLEAIGYATVIRGRPYHPTNSTLISTLKERKSGELGDLLEEMDGYDSPVVIGLMVRHACKCFIRLDLSERNLGYKTQWSLLKEFSDEAI